MISNGEYVPSKGCSFSTDPLYVTLKVVVTETNKEGKLK